MKRQERRQMKRNEADERAKERANRGDIDQIAKLNRGGYVATKERKRLLRSLESKELKCTS